MRRWVRHLEGWQLAVAAVGMALLAAILALPRTVAPREIPLPVVDREEQGEAERATAARAARVAREPLPFAVRAVGEALRRFGLAEARGDRLEAESLSAALASRAAEARRRYGAEPLLGLRAVQAALFVHAVRDFERTGVVPRELDELGGAFRNRALESGWVSRERGGALSSEALETLFTVRWTKLVHLENTFPFSNSLNEWRCYFRTLLTHPETRAGEPTEKRASTLSAYVKALARRDPDYPALLAEGILEHRMGHFSAATDLLAAHLTKSPTGPWRLRAQNYLLAARARVP